MPELNFELLQTNIRNLLKKHNITQVDLAGIAGMTQANVSKALNPKESKQFTLDQLYRISQHFGVSIDELVGNTAANKAETSPRASLAFITKLLCDSKLRYTTIKVPEWVYEFEYDGGSYPECRGRQKDIDYPAFYFSSYQHPEDYARSPISDEDIHFEFVSVGNGTQFQQLNEVLKKFLPMVKLYRETEIPAEAFQMVLNGYLEQLPEK